MSLIFTEKEQELLRLIAGVAEGLNQPAFLVGGFVRDRLLGRASKDMDIVCQGDGILLAEKVAERLGPGNDPVIFRNFGTAQVRTPGLDIEFVGARKESYNPDSRKPSVITGTLEEDMDRRDFTINTLAVDLGKDSHFTILDRFGGLKDLDAGLIRTPLAPQQAFQDDPLRMMRAARFAAQLHFRIHENALKAMEQERERIRIVSQERITDELNRIIASPKPSVGLDILFRTGLLQIIFPQMTDLAGVELMEGKGHKDNFYHTLQVLDNISLHTDNLWLRWAAVLHDIAKPVTKKFEPGHGWTFHGHDAVGGKMVPRIFARLKLPQHEPMRFVRRLVELHLRPISLSREDITDSAMRRLLFDAGDEIDALMTLCEADITSKNEMKVRRYRQNFDLVRKRLAEVEEKDRIRNWQPPVSGELIMETFGIPPGKQVGDLKNAIREAILDGQIGNNFEEAFAFMVRKAREFELHPVNQA